MYPIRWKWVITAHGWVVRSAKRASHCWEARPHEGFTARERGASQCIRVRVFESNSGKYLLFFCPMFI